VETQCGRKPPAASHLNLLLNKKILLQYFVLVQPYTSTGATTPFALVLADPFTSTQATTCYNALVLANPFTSTQATTCYNALVLA